MPVRYLKPGVRDSDHIDALSAMAETLFYRLLVTVDDFGRYDGRPAMIKASCFPIKESVTSSSCEQMLGELVRSDLISAYLVDGKPYIQIARWDNVPRAKESKYPPPHDGCTQMYTDARKCIQMYADDSDLKADVSGVKTGPESGQDGADPIELGQTTEKTAESHGSCGLEPSCTHLYTDVNGMSTDVSLTETKTETETETVRLGGEPPTPPQEDPPADKTKKVGKGPPDWIKDPVRIDLWGKSMPFGFVLPDDWLSAVADKYGCSIDVARAESEVFIEYWSNGKGRKQTRLDWFQTWTVWCSKSYAMTSSNLPASPQAPKSVNGSRTWEQMRVDNTRRAIDEFINGHVGVTIDA